MIVIWLHCYSHLQGFEFVCVLKEIDEEIKVSYVISHL